MAFVQLWVSGVRIVGVQRRKSRGLVFSIWLCYFTTNIHEVGGALWIDSSFFGVDDNADTDDCCVGVGGF